MKWEGSIKKILKEKAKQDIGVIPKRQRLFFMYKSIMNRRNFEYTLRHMFNYFSRCRFCKKNDTLRHGPSKRDMYLNRAIGKLKSDMSVKKLLNRAQIVEEMHQILFNPSDRTMM